MLGCSCCWELRRSPLGSDTGARAERGARGESAVFQYIRGKVSEGFISSRKKLVFYIYVSFWWTLTALTGEQVGWRPCCPAHCSISILSRLILRVWFHNHSPVDILSCQIRCYFPSSSFPDYEITRQTQKSHVQLRLFLTQPEVLILKCARTCHFGTKLLKLCPYCKSLGTVCHSSKGISKLFTHS